jgi:hypothetical protein
MIHAKTAGTMKETRVHEPFMQSESAGEDMFANY